MGNGPGKQWIGKIISFRNLKIQFLKLLAEGKYIIYIYIN